MPRPPQEREHTHVLDHISQRNRVAFNHDRLGYAMVEAS